MNLQPMQPTPYDASGRTFRVQCSRCDRMAESTNVRCDLDAPALTYYCDRCAYYVEKEKHHRDMLAFILSCGYRVFIRPAREGGPSNHYCFYTDGTRIGYAQWSDYRTSVSSVHKANKQTGTGFVASEAITVDTLKDAISLRCPNWAGRGDAETVHKWRDWDDFHNSSAFNSELVEVTP